MSKYVLPILFLTLGLSLESSCGPATAPCPVQKTDSCFCSRIQVGANYTYAHIAPSGDSSTSGNLGGLQALYEFKTSDRLYGALTFAFRDGNTTGDEKSRSILMFDVQERIGYTFNNCSSSFTCFTGFGYRHYGEDVQSSGSSVDFDYNEFYVPVGFLSSYKINCTYAIGLNAQWMPQVYPTVTIDPLKGARWIITNELANFRIEVPFTAIISCKHCLSVVFQPFFEYWQDGHTTAETTSGLVLGVPGNTYLFAGADLNLRYSF